MSRLVPRLDGFDPVLAQRVAMTVSCSDCDGVAKVEDAGEIREENGRRVQVMHNGVLVEEGGYFGDWMAEIIRCLRGHHEPQEELVFDAIVKRLRADTAPATMIEFGSFWTYYGLWFCQAFPLGRVVALEPDPRYLEVGRRNASLNGFDDRVTFINAAIGREPGRKVRFVAESDSLEFDVEQHDLASLMQATELEHADLVLADVQGAETVLLERASGDLSARRVRFLIVSTHHHSISGDPLTHQRALELLRNAGAHVISEHSVSESFSGDGLIAVSFDDRDRDFTVVVSHARSRDSLFGELECDLAAAQECRAAEQAVGAVQCEIESLTAERDGLAAAMDGLHKELAALRSERDNLQKNILAITSTKTWRWVEGPRRLYARIRLR